VTLNFNNRIEKCSRHDRIREPVRRVELCRSATRTPGQVSLPGQEVEQSNAPLPFVFRSSNDCNAKNSLSVGGSKLTLDCHRMLPMQGFGGDPIHFFQPYYPVLPTRQLFLMQGKLNPRVTVGLPVYLMFYYDQLRNVCLVCYRDTMTTMPGDILAIVLQFQDFTHRLGLGLQIVGNDECILQVPFREKMLTTC